MFTILYILLTYCKAGNLNKNATLTCRFIFSIIVCLLFDFGIIVLILYFPVSKQCNACACDLINNWNSGINKDKGALLVTYNKCIPKTQPLKACEPASNIFDLECTYYKTKS